MAKVAEYLKRGVQFIGFQPRVDRSVTLRFVTSLEMRDGDMEEYQTYFQTEGGLLFKPNEIVTVKDLKELPDVRVERTDKPPSVTLRAVLYRLWQKTGSVGDPDEHYKRTMRRIIEHYKALLDD